MLMPLPPSLLPRKVSSTPVSLVQLLLLISNYDVGSRINFLHSTKLVFFSIIRLPTSMDSHKTFLPSTQSLSLNRTLLIKVYSNHPQKQLLKQWLDLMRLLTLLLSTGVDIATLYQKFPHRKRRYEYENEKLRYGVNASRHVALSESQDKKDYMKNWLENAFLDALLLQRLISKAEELTFEGYSSGHCLMEQEIIGTSNTTTKKKKLC
ncbi:hypothetical protein G9A89_012325 [Geosiphon pyriformis]|nr:hypothetical protein G9A89_012325 [Geosiphon pyriformis]